MAKFTGHTITSDSALGGKIIEKSLRFNRSGAHRLNFTASSAGNRKTWTKSFWMKRTSEDRRMIHGYYNGSNDVAVIEINEYGDMHIYDYYNSYRMRLNPNMKFRDCTAWYHIVLALDTTQSTASDRAKLYVNGERVTSWQNITYPSQNLDVSFNQNVLEAWGTEGTNQRLHFDGYLADIYYVDGQQLEPTSFGFTESQTGVWKPKDYQGTYGQNGYHLEFRYNPGDSATTLGKDTSGNGNDWTPVGFSVDADFMTDSVTDSPTNNFCVLNYNGGSGNKPTDGGLSGSVAGTSGWRHTYGTFPLTRGKWYWEYRFSGSVDGSNGIFMGLAHPDLTYERDINSNSADMYGRQNQDRYANGTNTGSIFANVSSGDTVQFAFDADTGVMWSGLNNTWTGADPSTGNSPSFTGIDASKGYVPVTGSYGSNNYNKVNFGQQGFKYTPPSGFKAICSEFMETPEATIFNPKKHFRDLYYTGNGGTQSITGLEFQPDFVWIKRRDGGQHHALFDSLRGVLKSISTSRIDLAEYSESGSLNAFLPNGLGFNGQGYFYVNTNGDAYAAWCWKAGGSSNNFNIDDIGYSTASDAGITNGTINLTKLSVNTKGGFSVGLWTGSGSTGTVATGLTDTKIVILKNRTDANANWVVYHKVLDDTYDFLYFNSTNQNASSAFHPFDLDTTFKVGSNTDTNASSKNYVFYAWKEIPGYSKIGTYKGFGNENGPCVYCGFRPKFVIVKGLDSSEHWNVPVDTYNYNGVDKTISPNLSNAERDSSGSGLYGDAMDYLADGFKIKTIDANYNKSATTYLFMAFADTPNLPHFNQYPTAR